MPSRDAGWAVVATPLGTNVSAALPAPAGSSPLASTGRCARAHAVTWQAHHQTVIVPQGSDLAWPVGFTAPRAYGTRAWVVIEWGRDGIRRELICDASCGSLVVVADYAKIYPALLPEQSVLANNGKSTGARLAGGVTYSVTELVVDVSVVEAQVIGAAPLLCTFETFGRGLLFPVPPGARAVTLYATAAPLSMDWSLVSSAVLVPGPTALGLRSAVPGDAASIVVQASLVQNETVLAVFEVAP